MFEDKRFPIIVRRGLQVNQEKMKKEEKDRNKIRQKETALKMDREGI